MMPILSVKDAGAVCDFYADQLGFDLSFKMSDPDGNVHTAALNFDNEPVVMFTSAGDHEDGPRGVVLYFVTEDVDAYFKTVSGNEGVAILEELTDQFWGDRTFMVQDPFGNVLQFATHTGEMSGPPEGFTVEMAQPVG